MSFGVSPHSRQQLPQDSFYNDISQITTPIAININLDLFSLNDRNPQCEQNQEEIEEIVKWASPEKEYKHLQEKQEGKEKSGKPPGKWVKPSESFSLVNKKLLSLNLGEQNKIGEINQSLSTLNCSVMFNSSTITTTKTIFQPPKPIHSSSYMLQKSYTRHKIFSSSNNKSYTTPLKTQTPPPSNELQLRLYKLQHQCLIITQRLRSLSLSHKLYSHQLSTLRTNLLTFKSLLLNNKSLSPQFQPFLYQIETTLQISTYLQSSLQTLQHHEETIKGVVREIMSQKNLMQLVKVKGVKRVLKEIERLGEEFKRMCERKGWFDKGRVGEEFMERVKGNGEKVREVLELFDEKELWESLGKVRKDEVLELVRGQGMTEIERQVLLEIGCQLP